MKTLSERKLVLTLAALSAITPLAIDMYLPSITLMSKTMNSTEPLVSISISIFFLGLAFGQLFGGPISDAYGRKPIVLLGLGIFSVTSFLILFANDVYMLWILRFIQAFGGGVATVNVSAVVRDMFSGRESARIFSMIGSITILAPLLAPVMGLGLVSIFGKWEAVFLFLGIYSLLAFLFYRANFTDAPDKEHTKVTPIKNYLEVFKSGRPMILIIALVVSGCGFYAILTSSSVIYIDYFGLSQTMFVLCFAVNIVTLMAVTKINVRLVKKISPLTLLKFGLFMQIVLSVIMMILHNTTQILFMAPLIALFVGTLGFVFGNAFSIILEHFPKTSASANAVIGVLQYGFGAGAGMLANFFHTDGSLFALMCVILLSSVIGTAILILGVTRGKNLA
ncbi:MAG: multidrug effflux MFS transporter [Campylobacteraceae bacterium]|jgi:DHA1 family bicyclomycin/chloramphenicol resistance-like MFS transporter|nr:multidrug effflux MFS transporter [Campylobacteraceae bacterium]